MWTWSCRSQLNQISPFQTLTYYFKKVIWIQALDFVDGEDAKRWTIATPIGLLYCFLGGKCCKQWKPLEDHVELMKFRYLLLRHLRSHTGSTPFACEHCGNRFTTKERWGCLWSAAAMNFMVIIGKRFSKLNRSFIDRMRLHVRAIHIPEVKYKCEVCDRFFKTTSERRHHMSRIHMSKSHITCCAFESLMNLWFAEERLQCSFCGRLYAGSEVLRRHLKVCKNK